MLSILTILMLPYIALKPYSAPGAISQGATCFKTGEQVSGLNKICLYNCTGSTVAINVHNYEPCPVTIQR